MGAWARPTATRWCCAIFKTRSLAEVGAALGCEENAAQKRVNRALEKLRKFFTKRGVGFDGGDHCRGDFGQFRSGRAGGAGAKP